MDGKGGPISGPYDTDVHVYTESKLHSNFALIHDHP